MPKFKGYLKHIQYFEMEVEAETIEDAEDLMWEKSDQVDWSNPFEIDNDIVDVEVNDWKLISEKDFKNA